MLNVPSWKRRVNGVILLVLLAFGASLTIPARRHATLRVMGWALVVNNPNQHADDIVVAIDTDGAGALEAADLVHSGVGRA